MAEESAEPRGNAFLRPLPWAVLLLALAISGATLFVFFSDVAETRTDLPTYVGVVLGTAWGPVCCLIGALIASRRRGNLIGWLLVGLGFLVSVLLFTASASDTDHPAADAFNFLGDVLWILFISLFSLLILLFPDGRPPSPRWRPMVWFVALWPPLALLAAVVLDPAALREDTSSAGPGELAVSVLLVVTLIGVAVSALFRFFRSRGVERQQLKWFAYGTTVGLALLVIGFFLPAWGQSFADVGLYGPLLGIAVGLFRHRLYDIDFLIGRTFVYGALVAILAGVYSASIRLFNSLFVGVTGIGSEEALVITTLVLAASFTPIKKWLEGIVERRYKEPEEVTPVSSEVVDLADLETRVRAIVREELERSGRAG